MTMIVRSRILKSWASAPKVYLNGTYTNVTSYNEIGLQGDQLEQSLKISYIGLGIV